MIINFDEPDVIPPYNRDGGNNNHSPNNPNPNNPNNPNNDMANFEDILLISFITMTSIVGLFVISGIIFLIIRRSNQISEDDLEREEENQAYLELNSDEQELYFQSKEYLHNNPYFVGELTLSQNLSIQEKGVSAYEFVKDSMLTNNDLLVVNKTELNFFKNFECSAQTNLPMPTKNEVYYFECKLYSLPSPEETIISMGLSTKPYPWFRLPGRHPHSVVYDSNGFRRHNQPFNFLDMEPPFPQLAKGDVVGVGYRTRTGTVFFTRNGKKISELRLGGHVKNFKPANQGQLFPIVGANNICSVHVNLGQRGFVFIEGNVKNWGYAPIEGTGPAPPAYNKFNSDILLERSEILDDTDDNGGGGGAGGFNAADDNGLIDREHDFPPDFWSTVKQEGSGLEDEDDVEGRRRRKEAGENVLNHDKFSYNAYSEVGSADERITLDSLVPPHKPPSYHDDDEEGEGGGRGEGEGSGEGRGGGRVRGEGEVEEVEGGVEVREEDGVQNIPREGPSSALVASLEHTQSEQNEEEEEGVAALRSVNEDESNTALDTMAGPSTSTFTPTSNETTDNKKNKSRMVHHDGTDGVQVEQQKEEDVDNNWEIY